MAEDNKPAQSAKDDKKMVPESDLIALKKGSREREIQAKEELATLRGELADTRAELKIAKLNTEDEEEVRKVKSHLVDEDKELEAKREKLNSDLASLGERERGVVAKELASKYGVDVESISGEEDLPSMKIKALELHAENLAKEKEEASKESVYESGPGGTTNKAVWDKTEEEFEADVKAQRTKALSTR